MTAEADCIHGLTAATCATCKRGVALEIPVLNHRAIQLAVENLGSTGDFTTIDVATHPDVVGPHRGSTTYPRFNQLVGSYLTDAWQTLGIEQVPTKRRSNATWRRVKQQRLHVEDVAELPGWFTLAQIADRAGVTRQWVNKVAFERGAFPGMRRIERTIVVPEADVELFVADRE